MSDSQDNPYRSPAAVAEDSSSSAAGTVLNPYVLAGWTVVFALNLIVPLLLGSSLVREHGLLGMTFTMAALWLGGGWFCAAYPSLGRRLIAGSVLIAVTQVFPVAHFIVGVVAVRMAQELGLADPAPGDSLGPDLHLAGSILVTLLVGGFFMFGGFGLGCLLALFLPAEWFEPASVQHSPPDSKDRSTFRRTSTRAGGERPGEIR